MEQQILQWITIGIIIAFFAFDKAKNLFSKNRNKNDNNPYRLSSSISSMIMNHEKRITVNEEGNKALCYSIDEWKKDNKEDHKLIFEKLDKLAEKVK